MFKFLKGKETPRQTLSRVLKECDMDEDKLEAFFVRCEGHEINGLMIERVGTRDGKGLWRIVKTGSHEH